MIPIEIEGERRLKDGTRTGNFTFSKEFARAFMDMQDRAAELGVKIGLTLMIEKANVEPVSLAHLRNIRGVLVDAIGEIDAAIPLTPVEPFEPVAVEGNGNGS